MGPLLLFAGIFNMSAVVAQSPVQAPGNVKTVDIGAQDVSFTTANAYGKLIVYSPSIIRVRLDKKLLGRDFSYAVINGPQKSNVKITQDGESITVTTDSLKAVIYKTPFRIAWYTPEGQLINQDEPGLSTSWTGDEVTCYKTMMPDERFIGLGEKTGNLDRKGSGYDQTGIRIHMRIPSTRTRFIRQFLFMSAYTTG